MRFHIRADASGEIGAGHVVRCQALAGELVRRGHAVTFLCRSLPGNMSDLLRAAGFDVIDMPVDANCTWTQEMDIVWCEAFVHEHPADWLIVDHYALGVSWQRAIRGAGCRLLVINDLPGQDIDADILLDQNLIPDHAAQYVSHVSRECALLLGPGFALLRPEFAAMRQGSLRRRADGDCDSLLIFLGGGDVFEETALMIRAAGDTIRKWRKVVVVVGQACSNIKQLEDMLVMRPGWQLHVQTEEMSRLLCEADIAITGGGSISWEKCALGVPSLAVVLAENQAPIVATLDMQGAVISLGELAALRCEAVTARLNDLSVPQLLEMGTKAAEICRGDGAARVVDVIESQKSNDRQR